MWDLEKEKVRCLKEEEENEDEEELEMYDCRRELKQNEMLHNCNMMML